MTNSISIYTTFNKALFKITETTTPNVVEIDPVNIGPGVLTSILDQSVGVLKVGKNDFDNIKTGYILGLDDGVAKFYIGSSSSYLNWTGSALSMSGTITATAGTIGGFTISPTTLTGGIIQTATGSPRVELRGDTNRMNFISSIGTIATIYSEPGSGVALLDISLENSPQTNNRGIEMSNTTTSTGSMVYLTNTGSGVTMDITKSANNSTSVINVANTSGNGNTIALTTGNGNGIYIDSTPNNADTTNASSLHILVNPNGVGNGIFINDDSDSVGAAIKIDRDSTTGTASITGMSIDVDSSGGGIVVGIDLSGMATGQRVFKFVADATAAGAYAGRVAIDIGGSVKYLHYYDA